MRIPRGRRNRRHAPYPSGGRRASMICQTAKRQRSLALPSLLQREAGMQVRVLLALVVALPAVVGAQSPPELSTFSIVACDPAQGYLGVAVQSRVVGAGSIVPAAEAGVGAIATQAAANVSFKPRGLALLREGRSPEQVRDEFVRADSGIAYRQFAIIDEECRVAAFTGDSAQAWAGHRTGAHYSVQGNILRSEER